MNRPTNPGMSAQPEPSNRTAMSSDTPNPPLAVQLPPDPLASPLAPLLSPPFADAWAQTPPTASASSVRRSLMQRAAASRAAEAGLHTVRGQRLAASALADGISTRLLYQADAGRRLRPGEPLRVRLVDLQPGAVLRPELLGPTSELSDRHCEWLVMLGQVQPVLPGDVSSDVSGDASGEGPTLSIRDYHVTPAGHAAPAWRNGGDAPARLFLRESTLPAAAGDAPHSVRDADAGWPDFAPGIQRRVLWQRDGQAALLYFTQPGAQVPRHAHGHDEECLMLQGELLLDDLLLRDGDYQLAPAGTGHAITETDTGVVIYAHGDLDLAFIT